MIVKLKTELYGDIALLQKVEVQYSQYLISIYEESRKFYIEVSRKCTTDNIPKISVGNDNVHNIDIDTKCYDDAVSIMKRIESIGSFVYGIHSINYDEIIYSWIPETEEEIHIAPILRISRKCVEKKNSHPITSTALLNTLTYPRYYKEAELTFSYYRNASKFMKYKDYYFAVVNYFMFIEFLFADGEFKVDRQRPLYLKSSLLNFALLHTFEGCYTNKALSNVIEWIKTESKYPKICPEGKVNQKLLVEIILRLRGVYAHATKKSMPYYIDISKVKPLAVFLSGVCYDICGCLIIYKTGYSSDSKMNERLNDRIQEIKKRLNWT